VEEGAGISPSSIRVLGGKVYHLAAREGRNSHLVKKLSQRGKLEKAQVRKSRGRGLNRNSLCIWKDRTSIFSKEGSLKCLKEKKKIEREN